MSWRLRVVSILCLCLLLFPRPASAYSVLTHEAIVDIAWNDQIVPLIKARFPNVTADELKEAHAYAYGGAVIQDLGYYPFGSRYFSDLTHYVRSGDFVSNLLTDSQNPKEYAFAIGALAHYVSDIAGHPAVNRAVAIEYPHLESRFGHVITYEEDKAAHLQTEFGFDVLQVAKNRFTFDNYHSFIGFEVAQDLLARAFQDTYGIPLQKALPHQDLAIGTYRWSISRVIPEMTKVALKIRGKQIMQERHDFARSQFLYHISRTDYRRNWGSNYQKPGFGAKLLAFLLRAVPKVGPFRGLHYKDPSAQTEDMYFKSVNETITLFRSDLKQLAVTKDHSIPLQNRNFDTSSLAVPGKYALQDETTAQLTLDLAKNKSINSDPSLQTYLVRYFAETHGAPPQELKGKDRLRFMQAQDAMRSPAATSPPTPSTTGR